MGNTNQNTTINQDSVEVFNPYPYDNSVEILAKLRLDLLKECLEMTGVDFGKTNNKIEYRNYLINNPPFMIPTEFGGGDEYSIGGGFGSFGSSKFVDYKGPTDGSIGSRSFPQGKGKCIDPKGLYWPFYTFGFGASPKAKPGSAKPQRTGVECCKLAINTILGYLSQGCRTIGDVICMYHTGTPTYEKFLQYYSSRAGINDIADGRFVSSQEMIQRQNAYQQHLVDYVHMSNKTPVTRSYKVLFPLITFMSRQEQGVNCEEACRIALKEMGIT